MEFFHSIKAYLFSIHFGFFSSWKYPSACNLILWHVISSHHQVIYTALKLLPWDLPFLLTVLWSCLPGDEISLTVTPELNIFPSSLQYLLAPKVQPYLCWRNKGKKSPGQIESVFNVLIFYVHTNRFYINLKNAPKFCKCTAPS